MNDMERLTKAIQTQARIILEQSPKALDGNKAAARKVRKATLEIGNRCGKDYRAASILFGKRPKPFAAKQK